MKLNLTFRTAAGCLAGGLVFASLSTLSAFQRAVNRLPSRGAVSGEIQSSLRETLSRLPLAFEENRGQTDSRVRYLSRGSGYSLFLTSDEAVLSLRREGSPAGVGRGSTVRMRLAGANRSPAVAPEAKLPGRSHYYLGSDPKAWRRNVERFARVRYAGVYDGVDLVYYGSQSQLEYDFVVQPGADPGQIRLQVGGASDVRLSAGGDLLIQTAAGELKQHRPLIYQEIHGERKEIPGRYLLASAAPGQPVDVGFAVGDYDQARPLVIDPVLAFSTYLGGGGTDFGSDIQVDAQGYVYVTGRTASVNFPVANPQQGYGGGSGAPNMEGTDTFVTKLTPAGDALVFSTYLGGSGLDLAYSLSLDPDRNVYVAGQTSSYNFPVQAALQPTHGGGGIDAFLTKLDTAGFLQFSTYLGGAATDVGWSVLHDGQSNVYLGGATWSLNFPTLNALQPVHANTGTSSAAFEDGFVTKLSADGSALQFSTYLGASAGRESCRGLALDPSGNLCIGGNTTSNNFPVTAGARQPALAGRTDAFYTKLSPDGTQRLYATYFGGNYEDNLYGFGVDGQGNVYLSGFTFSTNLPTTFGAIRTVYQGGNSDGFLAKLNAAGNAYVYVTYLGSSGSIEYAYDLVPDAVGNVYVAGYTDSTSFFPLASPYQEYSNSLDGYVMRLDPAGNLLYSTYLGGMSDNTADYVYGIAADAAGNAYITGRTYSRYWPLVNPFQAVSGGPTSGDAFVAKLSPLHTVSPNSFQASAVSKTEAGLTWADRSNNETGFSLERSTNAINYSVIATLPPDTNSYVDPGRNPGSTYWYRLRAFNAEGYTQYASVGVIMPPDVPAAPTNLTVTPISSSVLRLTWSDNSDNESRFDVYRSSDGTNFGIIQYLGPNTTSYDDANLAPNTLYYYRVYASTSSASTASNQASGRTLPNPPSAPANLQVSAPANNQLRLTWTDTSPDESGFKIDRSPDGASWGTSFTVNGANQTSYLDSGLPAATTFYYRVRAFSGGGESANSNVASGTTNPPPPDAPSNLTVQGVGTTSVQLSWQDNSNNEEGFRVRRTTPTLPPVEALVPANGTGYEDTGLHSNTTYTYEVSAYSQYGTSAYSAPVGALTLPTAPTGLAGSATSTRVDLSWTDTNTFSPAQIQVERSDDAGATFSPLATAAAGAGGFADTSVQEDRSYQYRVRAVNTTGPSPYAGPITIATPLDPPAAPTSLSAAYNPTVRRVNMVWVDGSSNEAGFQIERSADGGANWALLGTVGAGVTGFGDSGWQPDAAHSYRVRAFNRTGTSAYSNVVTLSMPPAAPSGLTAATAGAGQILLQWSDNSSQEDAFVIERKTGNEAWQEARVVSGNSTQAYDLDLAADTLYTYRVRARNAVDVSDASNEASARTLPNPPAPPNGLTVQALVQGELSISWTDNSNNEDGFRVELWGGSQYDVLATVGANVTTYIHTGLAANSTYNYQVQAYNAGGLSGSVQTVGVQTLPSTPSNLSVATVSGTELDLSWTDTNPNPCGHEIERSTDGVAFSYRELVFPGVTTYRDTSLQAGTRYHYRVRAVNGAGPTPYSNVASAVTQLPAQPAAPSNLTATVLSASQVRLNWRDNSDIETEYRIERSTNGSQFTQVATVAANVTQYTSTGLAGNTKYWFRVRAANAGGPSSYSNTVNVRTSRK